MSETLENKTVQKTVESLERQLQAINYHFENAKKELQDLKLLIGNRQKRVNSPQRRELPLKTSEIPGECGCY